MACGRWCRGTRENRKTADVSIDCAFSLQLPRLHADGTSLIEMRLWGKGFCCGTAVFVGSLLLAACGGSDRAARIVQRPELPPVRPEVKAPPLEVPKNGHGHVARGPHPKQQRPQKPKLRDPTLDFPPCQPPRVYPPAKHSTWQYRASYRFRLDFGLSTRPQHIWRALRNPAFQRSIDDFGVPLTFGEQAEMARRDRVAARLGIVERYVDQHHLRNVYASLWIDQEHCGLIRVGFTVDPAPYMIDLVKLFPYPRNLRSFRAGISERALEALQRRFERDHDELTKEGFRIAGDGANISDNDFEITLVHPTQAQKKELRRRYGPHIRVISGQYARLL
jgi:hypothetical protein